VNASSWLTHVDPIFVRVVSSKLPVEKVYGSNIAPSDVASATT